MRAKHGVMAAIAAFAATVASAASITVDRVAQRWPWNNKVDITYTVDGGQDVALGVYARIVFTANIGGAIYTIDGVHDIGANASNGTHTVTWTLPSGVRATGCTMTAQLLTADNPSGDDYMVIDLDSNNRATAVSYEGILASQSASNARYASDDTYKKSKLVLRKVPAGGLYRTGHANYHNKASYADSAIDRTTTCAYYIGIFPVTQYQYTKLCNASATDSTLPNTGINWNTLRASAATAAQIPSVDSDTGSFFQRLNYKTGLYFDLPTEVMFEIAMRAGSTTVFYWGDDWNGDKVNYNSSGYEAVGLRDSNDWGLYNMVDNPIEVLRDNQDPADLATLSDPFVPSTFSSANRVLRGGAFNSDGKAFRFHASYRNDGGTGATSSASAMGAIGFRVACIIK
ncbi:MAG: SUMF1/EgtB/PvdO family nonheme iron enzyme [Kiritimatiellae bacterium]|nr:SUMF1/EgtB/PvdO family nonheme iron enzyme [Kiritimatiellia bacterium]